MKIICLTGTESTGKSELCELLAQHYNTIWVKEFARNYLSKQENKYTQSDLDNIAKGHFSAIEEAKKQDHSIVFVDTDILNIKIWSEEKYGHVSSYILDLCDKENYDLNLVCDIDLPWEFDPQRESEYKRTILHNNFIKALKNNNATYNVVQNSGNQRVLNAIEIIDDFLSKIN